MVYGFMGKGKIVTDEMYQNAIIYFEKLYNAYVKNKNIHTLVLFIIHLTEFACIVFTYKYDRNEKCNYNSVKRKLSNVSKSSVLYNLRNILSHEIHLLLSYEEVISDGILDFGLENFTIVIEECFEAINIKIDASKLYNDIIMRCNFNNNN